MGSQCYLGVDLGAESGRVMAGLWDGQQMRLEEVHRFSNGPVEVAATLRWDTLRLWSEIQHGLALAARRYGQSVVSVGVDTWGVDFVLLSKSSELLGLPFHYRDARTRGMLEEAYRRVPRAEIFAATGLQFMELNSLYQLLAAQRDNPEILAATDCLLFMPDFLHWCLSGVRAAEFTIASTSQFLNPKTREWARELLQRFGLPTRIFPEVVAPGTRLGTLRDSVVNRTGLGPLAVVTPAAHDTGSAVAAVPTTHTGKPNWAYLSSGTWSLIGVEVPDAMLSQRVLELNLTNEGGVDNTFRLLKNISGLWLVQQCKRSFDAQGRNHTYPQLEELAGKAPGLRSFINPDDARFVNPPDMPAALQEFCRETGQPVPQTEGELIRCASESLALKYAATVNQIEQVTGERIEVIHIVGGGSRNSLLNQMTADACERPVAAGPVEATVLGNVLVQARAAGEVKSLAEIRNVVRGSSDVRTYEPMKASVADWRGVRERFTRLSQQTR